MHHLEQKLGVSGEGLMDVGELEALELPPGDIVFHVTQEWAPYKGGFSSVNISSQISSECIDKAFYWINIPHSVR